MRKKGLLRKSVSIFLSTILVFSILCLFPGEIERVEAASADDLIAVAESKAGKTGAQLGYTDAWCARFVSDCAASAGLSSVIPYNASSTALRNLVLNNGGSVVTSPQRGDLVFYYSPKGRNYVHVGIMKSATSSIQGNLSSIGTAYNVRTNKVFDNMKPGDYVNGDAYATYIRPGYPTTSNSTLSVSPAKGTFSTNEDIVINWSSQTGAVKYGLTVRNSANQDVWDNYVTGNSRNIGRLAPGSYSILMLAYNSAGKGFGGVKKASFSVSGGSNPRICVDRVSGDAGCIYISGWAFDPDDSGRSLDVHVYIGGPAGTQGAECHVIKANVSRPDVNSAYGISGNHGFATYIPSSKRCTQKVYAYAINYGGGNDNTCGGENTASISGISMNVSFKSKSDRKGYTVIVESNYMPGVTKIQFPTWTDKNGQDDLLNGWETSEKASGKRVGNTYTFDVNYSDHNGEYGVYHTHIYAVYGDESGYQMLSKIGEVKHTISVTSSANSTDTRIAENSNSNATSTNTTSTNTTSNEKIKKTTKKISVSKTSVKVKKGKTVTVKVKVTPSTKVTKEKIKISCNNKNIKYSFDKKTGKLKIKGKKKGTSKITIKADKKKKTIKVKVTK